jgi:hypothetical protein
MTAEISFSTLESAPFNAVYSVVNDRTLITNPRNNNSITFVYDSDPLLTKGFGFNGFPYIILELPTLEYYQETISPENRWIRWTQTIIVRTARDGSANTRPDTGRTDMFTICDSMQAAFNSIAVRQYLRNLGLENVSLDKTSTDIVMIDQKQLYESQYKLTYYTLTTVIA